MHLHFERNVNTKCDCTILSLSWMGKVPDDIPEEEGWKLNRTNYYQEGWLATGNIRGIVGVTFTTSHCRRNMDFPLRTNYNLRGHRSDVILVKWNEPYQKLASCDSSGIIFVWIKYEGRWSIELINDRNTPVTYFSWSHDGRMALICYQDGFVLVGSVAGQRYWSSMLNLESTITCGIWTPDDQQVYFGTTQGQVIVMDVHGAMVSQVQLCNDVGITSMAWSCEKFKMEEGEESEPGVTNASKRSFVLAVSFQNGFIYLLKSFDDVSPAHINTGLSGSLGMVMEWSNSRELLAVAGTSQTSLNIVDPQGSPLYENLLKFYTESGNILYQTRLPNTSSPVSALTWGHNDKRLFIATGTQVHIAWVSRRIASLQLLCRLQIQSCIGSERTLPLLPLPSRIRSLIGNLFAQTIRCCVPDLKSLREFVSRPPMCSTRLHCTMIRHDDDANQSTGTCYTLYLEYLGGLVPLLKGKRTSKIRPEFVIFDPQANDSPVFFQYSPEWKSSSGSSQSTTTGQSGRTDSSDSEFEERYRGSPRGQRQRKTRQKKRQSQSNGDKHSMSTTADQDSLDELAYVDTLPEEEKLVEVTSNIWGTKFKIHGLAKTVPANLGQVTYKTSLLHLQPRQMTLVITELRDDFPSGPDPSFNPHIFSEDEDEAALLNGGKSNSNNYGQIPVKNAEAQGKTITSTAQRRLNDSSPPIAPMTPRPNHILARHKNSLNNNATQSLTMGTGISPLAKAESYDDDSSTESQDVNGHLNGARAAPPTSTLIHATNGSNNSKLMRPKNITATTPGIRNSLGPGYSSFKNNYSRSSSNSSCQSRHAISPLYCDGSVPTLQSPKNAVAPTDIIFERPAVSGTGQTTVMSYSTNTDYTNNVVQVKNALLPELIRSTNSHVNPVPLNLNLNLERMDARLKTCASGSNFTTVTNTASTNNTKRRDMLYIDEETQSPTQQPLIPITPLSTTPVEVRMKRTTTIVSIAPALPDSITRSCSVGYLDSVAITPSDEALMALRRDAPNKRLILVDKRRTRKKRLNNEDSRKPKLEKSGKSKSLDSCDLVFSQTKLTSKDLEKTTRKLQEIAEGSTSSNETNFPANCFKCHRGANPSVLCKQCQTAKLTEADPKKEETIRFVSTPLKKDFSLESMYKDQHQQKQIQQQQQRKKGGTPRKKKLDVITSFTDSPLFTRKHRFGIRSKSKETGSSSETNTESSTPLLGRKNENSFSFVKQLTEARWRRKEAQSNLNTVKPPDDHFGQTQGVAINGNAVEVTPVEAKASVSLQAQALTTLENIISRLRDLDEGRLTPPATPQRLPRSSPASPAASKKNKHQSSSPIRHILNSPLLNRRYRKKQCLIESSDDEGNGTNGSGEENGGANYNKQYRDLETFQKAQLLQKLKRGKIEPNGSSIYSNPAPVRREFVMHNKAPMWNEMSQVYQLDFGGRVTQESAKNFQIEFRGKQVMQFGRIDGNAYTLDFQYPFSALQAFAVALANVTQRLK
ncbi:PREDICTED: tubby-related protein 4 [Rhagoletis zephyria]|uniref:tubby-related protein 4 n=1 Tax=Rhagoletis zephyria TaxID=28612 RepID=UPI0008116FBB|nr:PREDICTED: tubby-related protein 4 [Rhagoletis zephyria]XP_017478425.1 PREDICTED: tubby-related protein 4 [Rhagoletis zephyria]